MWVPRLPLDGRQRDVESLARAGEMNLHFSTALCPFHDFRQRAPDGLSDDSRFVALEETMAIELDENPLRPPPHCDVGAAPTPHPIQIERVVTGQGARVEFGDGQ